MIPIVYARCAPRKLRDAQPDLQADTLRGDAMASQPVTGLLRALLVAHDPYVELPDADLLARFHFQREQAAFAELVDLTCGMILTYLPDVSVYG